MDVLEDNLLFTASGKIIIGGYSRISDHFILAGFSSSDLSFEWSLLYDESNHESAIKSMYIDPFDDTQFIFGASKYEISNAKHFVTVGKVFENGSIGWKKELEANDTI